MFKGRKSPHSRPRSHPRAGQRDTARPDRSSLPWAIRAGTLAALASALASVAAPALGAQENVSQGASAPAIEALRQEVEALRREYEGRLQTLEARLAELAGRAPAAALPAPVAPPPVGAGAQPSTYFNPAMAVVGNFLAVGGSNPVEDAPSQELREAELAFQAIVDPYARADVFLDLGEEGVEVEEGYLTFTSLPAQLLAKVGRMRTAFGKANTLHLDALPWPDEPLPIVNLLGSEEGWIGTGVSVSRLIALPADTFSELTLEVFRGDAEGLFAAEGRSDLAWNAHYRVFHDLSDAVNVDLGLSYAVGPAEEAPAEDTEIQGLDATLRWKPPRTALYRGAVVRAEVLRSVRDHIEAEPETWGGYLSAEYRLARRWTAGARLEASDRALEPDLRDRGYALLLGFAPSEFTLLRGELRRREYDGGLTADELFLQIQFSMGAHAAHPF